MFIPKEKPVQSAKWDPRSERCIFVGYNRSGIASPNIPITSQESSPVFFKNISDSIRFPKDITLESLNQALENDGGDGLDHFHVPLQGSQANIDSPLSSLASIPEPIPSIPVREL